MITVMAVPPLASISSWVRHSSLMSAHTMVAPSSAQRNAVARPIPWLAPVTMPTLPSVAWSPLCARCPPSFRDTAGWLNRPVAADCGRLQASQSGMRFSPRNLVGCDAGFRASRVADRDRDVPVHGHRGFDEAAARARSGTLLGCARRASACRSAGVRSARWSGDGHGGDACFVAFPTATGRCGRPRSSRRDSPRDRSMSASGCTQERRSSRARVTWVTTSTSSPVSPRLATAVRYSSRLRPRRWSTPSGTTVVLRDLGEHRLKDIEGASLDLSARRRVVSSAEDDLEQQPP